eukprot:244132-Chlamydomonas_euryale.AAC.4
MQQAPSMHEHASSHAGTLPDHAADMEAIPISPVPSRPMFLVILKRRVTLVGSSSLSYDIEVTVRVHALCTALSPSDPYRDLLLRHHDDAVLAAHGNACNTSILHSFECVFCNCGASMQ